LVVVDTFKLVPFQVYAVGPVVLPLLEAPLELCVRWSAIISELLRHHENDTLLAEISFSETKKSWG
jgi:hypothetical protein